MYVKELWKYRLFQHGCVMDCSSALLFLLLPLHSLLPPPPHHSLSSVRVLGVAVLSRWPVPTLTPSLTPGRGIESQDHWKAVEVTARRGPDWGWCSESRWAPASGTSSLEGCWPLLLPSPPEGESHISNNQKSHKELLDLLKNTLISFLAESYMRCVWETPGLILTKSAHQHLLNSPISSLYSSVWVGVYLRCSLDMDTW